MATMLEIARKNPRLSPGGCLVFIRENNRNTTYENN